jgi:nucleoside-diphosphate-sugar epimerase
MTLRASQNNKVNDSVIHIGDDKEVSIKEVAEIILDISDIDQKLVLNNAPEGSVSRRCPDLTLAKDLDIYHNAISIREGLIKTIEELK